MKEKIKLSIEKLFNPFSKKISKFMLDLIFIVKCQRKPMHCGKVTKPKRKQREDFSLLVK